MSTNLGVPQLSPGQALPEVTANDATGALDAALTETLTGTLSAGLTLTVPQFQKCARVQITTSNAGQTLTLPPVKKITIIQNDSANPIAVAVGAATLSMPVNSIVQIYTD